MESINQTLYINNLNSKLHKNTLQKYLYFLFSQYGRVLQVVVCKGVKLRGQAWVVFADAVMATNAMRDKQGFVFYNQPMKIAYAQKKSEIIERQEMVESAMQKKMQKRTGKRSREGDEIEVDTNNTTTISEPLMTSNNPSKILFAQNLPVACDEQMLATLFQHCAGLIDLRIVPGDKGMAFIEFENEIVSGIALRTLNGFQISDTNFLHLTYSN